MGTKSKLEDKLRLLEKQRLGVSAGERFTNGVGVVLRVRTRSRVSFVMNLRHSL